MTEEWRKIQGYEEYEVSNLGQVRRGQRVLKPVARPGKKTSYYHLALCKDSVKRSFYIHRLVALAFLPNPENKTTVNHRDHNGLNNCLDNLEWATYQEQNLHSPHPPGISGHLNIRQRCGSYQVVIQRTRKTIFNKTFPTLPEAIKARDDFLN
jgi:hypothetical protein